jgi:hypothetical protein
MIFINLKPEVFRLAAVGFEAGLVDAAVFEDVQNQGGVFVAVARSFAGAIGGLLNSDAGEVGIVAMEIDPRF